MQRAPNHNYNMNAPITVKGDNDQDVNITIKKPNEGAQALVSSSEILEALYCD